MWNLQTNIGIVLMIAPVIIGVIIWCWQKRNSHPPRGYDDD